MMAWAEIPLGEVLADASPGFACGDDVEDGVFQFRMNNITTEGRLDLSKRRRVPRDFRNIDRFLVHPGDVLFNATNSPDLVGKTAFFPGLEEPAVFSNHFLRLRPRSPEIDGRFLTRWLNLQFLRGRFSGMCRQWVNQATVSRAALLSMRVPLPPLAEQRRIAMILDKADGLRAKRGAALEHLGLLRTTIFRDRFLRGLDGEPVDLAKTRSGVPDGWSWELLTEAARLATGHTPDRERSDYWNGEIPWISLTDVRSLDGKIATATIENVSDLGIENSSAVKLPIGTVCFSRTASVGFVTVMGKEMSTSQDFVNWVCGPRLDPTYLMWALITARRRLQSISSGSTHKTIYMRVVEQFRVLVPPIELQRQFARQSAHIDTLEADTRAATFQEDALFASLQHRAFRGEL